MSDLTIPAIYDAHVHLRDGAMLSSVAPYSGRVCDWVLVMPNLASPIDTYSRWREYSGKCKQATRNRLDGGYDVGITVVAQLMPYTTPAMITTLYDSGCPGLKLYPKGVTTNSDHGISAEALSGQDPGLLQVLATMEKLDMVLLCHGEWPGEFCLDREARFRQFLYKVAENYPNLRISVEHITTRMMLDCVRELSQRHHVVGTITAHHLIHTLDDVVGSKLRPDHFCKPIAKYPADRAALIEAATGEENCFFFGSDSAPHTPEAKYACEGCAGVFSAPVMVSVLAGVFEAAGKLPNLEAFTSTRARAFYRLTPPKYRRTLHLSRLPWTVDKQYGGIVPLKAGETLDWRIDKVSSGRS